MYSISNSVIRHASVCVAAMAFATAALPGLALNAQGTLFVDIASGTSEARWEIDSAVQGAAQPLNQVNPCSLATTPDLLGFASPSGGTPSAKQDAIGIDQVNGNGTACAGIDQRGSTSEALTLALGPRFAGAVPAIRFFKLVLQLELKGSAVVAELSVNDSISGAPAESWEVRGGSAVNPLDPGRDPDDINSANRVIDCLGGGTDVAPDARDTCVVSIAAFGDSFTITANAGSISLEGGRSIAGPSEIHLTDASGIYDCGDTITSTAFSQGGLEIASASCRRLDKNLVNCPAAACVAVPADLRFENDGYELVLEYDEGDQCVAVQCQIGFAPFDLTSVIPNDNPAIAGSRVGVPVTVNRDGGGNIIDQYPLAGIETTYIPPPIVQFQGSDPEYYLQHCLEILDFLPAVDVSVLSVIPAGSVAPPFVAGEIVSNGIIQATVKSYAVMDGHSTLVYALLDPLMGDFAAGDTLSGPSGSATVLNGPRQSGLIDELLGSILNPDGAGYELPDYSPPPGGKTNDQGIQHACLKSLTSDLIGYDPTTGLPAADFIRQLIDVYLQGDIRFAVGR